MMAHSTFGLAYGGPNRTIEQKQNQSTDTANTEITATSISAAEEVQGWYHYDPSTEGFHQSSVDEEQEEEQIAAQTLVDVCEQALDATTCGCEQAQEDDDDTSLMRSSFSFGFRKEVVEDSPSASPRSEVYGTSNLAITSTAADDGCGDAQQKGLGSESFVADNGFTGISQACSPSSTNNNEKNIGITSLTLFPQLRGSRLGSHRGSVMEAGIVLDTRSFGGIGIVQEGRKVGVQRS